MLPSRSAATLKMPAIFDHSRISLWSDSEYVIEHVCFVRVMCLFQRLLKLSYAVRGMEHIRKQCACFGLKHMRMASHG